MTASAASAAARRRRMVCSLQRWLMPLSLLGWCAVGAPLFHEADSLLSSTNAVLQEPQNCTWLSKASALVDLAPPNESVSLRSEVTIDVYNTQRTLLARKSRLIRVRDFECHPNCLLFERSGGEPVVSAPREPVQQRSGSTGTATRACHDERRCTDRTQAQPSSHGSRRTPTRRRLKNDARPPHAEK